MAFIVEDGTIVDGATSYVAEAFSDAYFTDLAVAEWTDATPSAKKAALVNGSEYASLRWGRILSGVKMISTQPLEFPRYRCTDVTGGSTALVPVAWKQAICNYALQYLQNALYQSTDVNDTRQVQSKSVTIGPIKTATTFTQKTVPRFPKADRLASRYVYAVSQVIRN
jgi:hypothetical protein